MFVGDTMFFAIDTIHEPISGIRYYLDSCTVSASIDGEDYSYAMIQGGCTSQPNYAQVHLYENDGDLAIFDEHIGVSYRSFQFRREYFFYNNYLSLNDFSANAPDTVMEMTCNVRACVEADCPTSC